MQHQHSFGFLLPQPKKIPPGHKEIEPDMKSKQDKHCMFRENGTEDSLRKVKQRWLHYRRRSTGKPAQRGRSSAWAQVYRSL